VNGGANVESHDKDGLTGNCLQIGTSSRGLKIGVLNIVEVTLNFKTYL